MKYARVKALNRKPKEFKTKECPVCHGSELGYMRGKRGRIEVVLCPECLGNGFVADD